MYSPRRRCYRADYDFRPDRYIGGAGKTLWTHFRDFTGTTAMRYLRNARRERVYQELRRGDQETRVTEIAMKMRLQSYGPFFLHSIATALARPRPRRCDAVDLPAHALAAPPAHDLSGSFRIPIAVIG